MHVMLISADAFSEALVCEALQRTDPPCTEVHVVHDGRQALKQLLNSREDTDQTRMPNLAMVSTPRCGPSSRTAATWACSSRPTAARPSRSTGRGGARRSW